MIVRRVNVYVASKASYGPRWQLWRERWRAELPHVRVVSSWIDISGPGEGLDWALFLHEAKRCDVLIAEYHSGEEWNGAFVEIGAALAVGADVICIGDVPPGSWVQHPNVTVSAIPGYDAGMALVDWLAARKDGAGL
jgi:hypothetical protein